MEPLRSGIVMAAHNAFDNNFPIIRPRADEQYTVTRGWATVVAARDRGITHVEVDVRSGDLIFGKPIFPTLDQRGVIDAAVKRLRWIEDDPDMSVGRVLELVCADFMAGVGWPDD
jgi:hypothetical protein